MDTSSSSDWDKLELLMKQMKDLYREMYTSSDYFVLKTLSADCLESPNGRFDNKVEVTAAFRKFVRSVTFVQVSTFVQWVILVTIVRD